MKLINLIKAEEQRRSMNTTSENCKLLNSSCCAFEIPPFIGVIFFVIILHCVRYLIYKLYIYWELKYIEEKSRVDTTEVI